MSKKYPSISAKFPHLIHGADYNPDQWQHRPDILKEDLRLMKLAGCNVMSVGIFAWSALEPEEGKFHFDWLDRVMDNLAKANMFVILATPTGSRPAWMSRKYPEVLRVNAERRRNLYGLRHNHCYTSPIYREKTKIINRKLAERYKNHPAHLLWHVSNEYSGECHCELCQEAFRSWLKRKYEGSLERLNLFWWTSFWSHTYTEWEQIESPCPHGEPFLHGLTLDWKRFVTHQTIDFMKKEIAPLREITPDIPVTTNMMGTYPGLNYWKFAEELDVISWDSYPCWHGVGQVYDFAHPWDSLGRDWRIASDTAFVHNIMRSLKSGKPFMLMESTPTFSNWHTVHKLKRPGMHMLSSLLAVAHGSDTVQYFQWRKSRGSYEKFHGAVVDHAGTENTRVFREVAEVEKLLERLDDIVGTTALAQAAIIYDWENRWALEEASGLRAHGEKKYEETCKNHYYPLWAMGIPVDVIDMEQDFSKYRLIIAPLLYMVRPGVAERLESFVREGGILVATYWSGIVDENDLCFLGGFPGPLRNLLGICSEEIDSLYPEEKNHIAFAKSNDLGLSGEYETRHFCDLIHVESARTLAEYKDDFYQGRPALTVNEFGKGRAYYIASRNEERFLKDFYSALIRDLKIRKAIDTELPEGVTAQMRTNGEKEFIFILNFTQQRKTVNLGTDSFLDVLSGEAISGIVPLETYGFKILQR